MKIERAAVIGSGVMGAGIAAHFANAGIPVVLLDIPAKEGDDRSAIAKAAIARLLKTDPAPFMHARNARLVTPGNLEDDLHLLADVDWIVEAIVENPAIKANLYRRIDPVRKAGSVVSSNTSTIPLARLVEGQSEQFARDFLVTHFFNPPRYMRLLEVVGGEKTRADAVAAVSDVGDRRLGKGVVTCKDTPGFIANRIGVFWLQTAVNLTVELGLDVEDVDAVAGKPMGVPKTGIFGLIDLVGLDLMPHIARSLLATLPPGDAYCTSFRDHAFINKLIAEGYTGRKGKGGFYRLNKTGGKRLSEAFDIATGDYRPKKKVQLASLQAAGRDLRALADHPDKTGQYVRKLLAHTLSYAASLVPEIADDLTSVDEAMRLGYAWKYGPFELIDRLGTDWFAALCREEGIPVPALVSAAAGRSFYRVEEGKLQYLTTDGVYRAVERPDGVLLLSDVKRASRPVWKNGSASLWDIGDGVLCVEFTSKMNALDADIMAAYQRAIKLIGDGKGNWKALVVHNEADNFSVGANLGLALFAVNVGLWPQIEELTSVGQRTYRALKYAPFPVVSAPAGMALGGGCEILLHSDHVQAHAETYMGLVEVGVGLLPGWGGCTEVVFRHAGKDSRLPRGPMPGVARAFEIISTAKVGKSAEEARDYLYLRPSDAITMNRSRLLADAKAKALELANDYTPPEKSTLSLPGPGGKVALDLAVEGFVLQGKATPYDKVVSAAVARVLSGGDTDPTTPVSEDDILRLEREEFMGLIRNEGTIDRVEHMLTTGKPLRN